MTSAFRSELGTSLCVFLVPEVLVFLYTGASIKPSQEQGPPLPLIPDRAIPCYICFCSHVYPIVGGLIPGRFRGIWVADMVLPMELQTPSATLVLSLSPPLRTLCSVQWFAAAPSPVLSGSGRASQETDISGSCQQEFLDIYNSVWIWWLHMGWIRRQGCLWMMFSSVSATHFVSRFAPIFSSPSQRTEA